MAEPTPEASAAEPAAEEAHQVHEPEESDTTWMRIRLACKRRIGDVPYQNWFTATCQLGQVGSTLFVAVADSPNKQELESSFMEQMRAVIREQGLDVRELVFVVDDFDDLIAVFRTTGKPMNEEDIDQAASEVEQNELARTPRRDMVRSPRNSA